MRSIDANFNDDHPSTQPVAMREPSLLGVWVLVIEDSALVRAAMESILASWGCQTTLANGTPMACDTLQQDQAPDIILSDYQLNDGYDGINAIRLIREISGRQIPACLISASDDQSLTRQADAAGVYFLPKPLLPTKLLDMLWRLHPSRVSLA